MLWSHHCGSRSKKKALKVGKVGSRCEVTDGSIEFAVNKVDESSGEWSGVFVSEQLSDTDMGSKAPKKVLIKGIISGKVDTLDGSEEY